jgi:hypothetical protein
MPRAQLPAPSRRPDIDAEYTRRHADAEERMSIDWPAALRLVALSVVGGVVVGLVALAFWYAALDAMARLG